MGKDRHRLKDEEGEDYSRLKQLAKLMRGVKPKQRSKFHVRKPKVDSLKDVANEYNRDGKLDDTDLT